MIGVFDSGSGGLTVLRALREELPSADVVYFGDIKHAPYGSRSHAELSKLTVEALKLLQARGASKVVSACNSVSASLALSIFDAFGWEPNHVVEMVGPTVSYFKDSPERLALCATPATIASGIYQNAFAMIGKEVLPLPITELAGAIEFGRPKAELEAIVAGALQGRDWSGYDVLLLACTHFPLVQELFERAVPSSVVVCDPAIAVARRAQKLFWPQEVADGKTRFIISQESPPFRALVARMFPDAEYTVEVLE